MRVYKQIRKLPNGRVKAVVAPGVEVLKSVFHRFTDASNGVGVRLLALIAMATAAEDPAAERVLFAEGCLEIAIASIKVRQGRAGRSCSPGTQKCAGHVPSTHTV